MAEQRLVIEEVDDPAEIARFRAQEERARRNIEWLASHWPQLLPQARGRFVAVAGQEGFIGESVEDAVAKASATHPDDAGMIVQYVRPERGPRVYASRRPCAS
jgi:hypothetical protein